MDTLYNSLLKSAQEDIYTSRELWMFNYHNFELSIVSGDLDLTMISRIILSGVICNKDAMIRINAENGI